MRYGKMFTPSWKYSIYIHLDTDIYFTVNTSRAIFFPEKISKSCFWTAIQGDGIQKEFLYQTNEN